MNDRIKEAVTKGKMLVGAYKHPENMRQHCPTCGKLFCAGKVAVFVKYPDDDTLYTQPAGLIFCCGMQHPLIAFFETSELAQKEHKFFMDNKIAPLLPLPDSFYKLWGAEALRTTTGIQ